MSREEGKPRFAADAMLGSLARWLRLLGFDTKYRSSGDEPELVRLAVAEERWLITRHHRLAGVRRQGLWTLLLLANDLKGQLIEMRRAFPLAQPQPLTRCILCNVPLKSASAQEAVGHLPEYVLQSRDVFHRCPGCRRFYWAGSHRQDMEATLRETGWVPENESFPP